MANVLNMEIVTLEKEEGPAFGAAILAAIGCGEYKNAAEAASAIVRMKAVYTPDSAIVSGYESRYQQFKQIYPAVTEWFHNFEPFLKKAGKM